MLSGADLFHKDNALVFINGLAIGIHRHPKRFVRELRALRRRRLIHEFVSVYEHSEQKSVHISTDGGRVCRPLIIVEKGRPLVQQQHIDDLGRGFLSFHDFLKKGLIEFLDVNEENNGMSCIILCRGMRSSQSLSGMMVLKESEISSNTTHLEIDPMTILGVCAGLIPYPHHNQSPRNTYQCIMGKQAIGSIAYNQLNRIDTLLYLLCYPQKPLVKTKTIEMIGFEDLPAGHVRHHHVACSSAAAYSSSVCLQNAMVAVMSYSGYDIEDAIVLNKASLDRGFGRCQVFRNFSTMMKRYPNGTVDRIVAPPLDCSHERDARFRGLDRDGICEVGAAIKPRDILVTKQVRAVCRRRFLF